MKKWLAALAAASVLMSAAALAEAELSDRAAEDEPAGREVVSGEPAETPVEVLDAFELAGDGEAEMELYPGETAEAPEAAPEEAPPEEEIPEASDGGAADEYGVDLSDPAYGADNPARAGTAAWYCWGRVREKCGVALNWNDGQPGDAARWYESAREWTASGRESAYTLGAKARENAVAVYGDGRLAFVESAQGGDIWATEWRDGAVCGALLDPEADPPEGYIYPRAAVAGGQCGEGVYWNLYADRTLEISGRGDMWDCDDSPWSDGAYGDVQQVNICAGVTGIGAGAFGGVGMRGVTMADTVSSMGPGAFRGCPALREIALSKGLSAIADRAFEECYGLRRVELPDGLSAIGEGAFRQSGLKQIALPEGLETIGAGAFARTPLTALYVPAGVNRIGRLAFGGCWALAEIAAGQGGAYAARDNALYTADGETLLLCAPRRSGTFVARQGVKHVEAGAFEGSELTEVVLPEGVEDIGDGAFTGASGLRRLNLPSSLTHIGAAFVNGPARLSVRAVYGTYGHRYCRRQDASHRARGAVERYKLTMNIDRSDGAAKLYVGEKLQLSTERSGAAFESDAPWCASVSNGGLITAMEAGSGRVFITDGTGARTALDVVVTDPYTPTGIALDGPADVTLAMDSALTLKPALRPASAWTALTWTTSDATVATVDAGGTVSPVGEGFTVITVTTENGLRASARVEVINPYKVREIALDRSGVVALDLHETLQLSVALTPASAKTPLTWKTSNARVATVSDAGLVTPVGKGTARITVSTANRKSASVKVKVADLYTPVKVMLNHSGTLKLRVGQEVRLSAELSPATAKTAFRWTTSDSAVAGGSSRGANATIRARAPGTAIITVTTENGRTDTVRIKVVK